MDRMIIDRRKTTFCPTADSSIIRFLDLEHNCIVYEDFDDKFVRKSDGKVVVILPSNAYGYLGCNSDYTFTFTPIDIEPNTPPTRPNYYNSHPSGVECLAIAQHHSFNIGNAIKYIWRNGLKDGESSVKDLQKAIDYLRFEIELIESKNNDT